MPSNEVVFVLDFFSTLARHYFLIRPQLPHWAIILLVESSGCRKLFAADIGSAPLMLSIVYFLKTRVPRCDQAQGKLKHFKGRQQV